MMTRIDGRRGGELICPRIEMIDEYLRVHFSASLDDSDMAPGLIVKSEFPHHCRS